jgi:transposase-like protein
MAQRRAKIHHRAEGGNIEHLPFQTFNNTLFQSFSDVRVRVRVRKFWTLKTIRTRTQRVCLFTHLYTKKVNISQKKSEISIFSFLKSYYSLYKPHVQISTIVKTS